MTASTSPTPARLVSLYTIAVVVGGIVVVTLAFFNLPADLFGMVLFAATAALAELTEVELFTNSRSRVSVSSVIAIAAMVALGPFAGVLAHLFSGAMTILVTALRPPPAMQGRVSWLRRSAFNTGMWVLAAGAAAGMYQLFGGTPGVVADFRNLIPLMLASTTDVFVNLALLIGVIAFQTSQNPFRIWQENFQWAAPIAIAGNVIGGGMLALAYQMFGLLGVAVFLLPILATAYSFRLYMRHSQGYVEQIEKTLADLRQSDERYALATHGANDGLWDWKLDTGQIFYSPRWKAMLGHNEEELSNHPDEWFDRVHPEDRAALQHALNAHIQGESPHFEHEHRILHQDGSYRWVLTRGLAVRNEQGAYRMAGSQSEITARKTMEAQLVHEARHDALTGLPNRTYFLEQVKALLERLKYKNGDSFAVLFLDFDRFKSVNDSLGHAIGDQLLEAVARRLDAELPPGTTIARLGGDEFTILLRHMKSVEVAKYTAERIQGLLKFPFNIEGNKVFITTSIGIAMSSPLYENAEDILRDADIAMYRAKETGKMRYTLFEPGMRTHALVQLAMETELRRALEAQEFVLHYQPILDIRLGAVIGFEALIRWNHPEKGLMLPATFISVAEESGLYTAIDHWVLTNACRQLKEWQSRLPGGNRLIMSVNLSSRHFTHVYLVDYVREILESTGVTPTALQLEITESSLMGDSTLVNSMLAQLRALGIRLTLDDFGTGYSSLSYLKDFTFDGLKVERSFIQRMGLAGESTEIVRTIVNLAHELGLTVTAEGIENPAQLALLKSMGCEYAQGHHFAQADVVHIAERSVHQYGVRLLTMESALLTS